MTLIITDLAKLDPAQTANSLATTTEMIQELQPDAYVSRGVLHDLLLYMHALLDSQIQSGTIARYLSARSLLDIENDPTLADPGVVDAVLSNFRITRGAGASAVGEITIVISSSAGVTIANGAVFTANGNTYTANSAFTAKSEAAQINSATDVLLTLLDDGNYAFTINVTATVAGTASIVVKNTLMVPEAPPTSYVTSYATSDFTGGLDPQNNNELLQRLQQGVSCQAPSNRTNMQAMLLAQPAFNRVIASSIVGYGDEEMLRDQHTIWPGSMGGRCDWYVRTTERLTQLTLSKEAVLIAINTDGTGNWQFPISKDDAPGFYEVVSVVLPTSQNVAGTLPILSDTRSNDLNMPGFIPDIETVAEGAYTRFQTAVIVFNDTVTSTSGLAVGAKGTYNVTVSLLLQIDQVQDFVSGYKVRSYGSDTLVKAPMPCFVVLHFRIAKNRTQADPDLVAIQTAVAHAVNTVGFTGRLYAAMIQDVIGGYLAEGMSVGSIDMLGRLRLPDGTMRYVRDNEVLIVPTIAAEMISSRTVQFFVDPVAGINITVSTEIPV